MVPFEVCATQNGRTDNKCVCCVSVLVLVLVSVLVLVLVSVLVSCRGSELDRKGLVHFMGEDFVDQEFIFGTDEIETALNLPSGLLFLAIFI
jgi:hypothetical protein